METRENTVNYNGKQENTVSYNGKQENKVNYNGKSGKYCKLQWKNRKIL